ncbi:hypothetical protein [Arcobacter aquimarinus]|uniref:ABC-type transport auxiliary lipoprotein component domain-containing protein n=1 Tax=Arcobacter aquimarinus TaxID=1315211 RepID=A0AAE7B4N5_9BACT|nr:hypothetical protein [Arcobacter aquimarinus]QKE25684.1 hypothetical protein AAQM_0927 [Arcobacter aquimarinus]RXI36142.1 hypothetical protein CP986_03350 [Arcobacter aquimarinus]
MKYLNLTFLVFMITFFSACSSKQPLNLNEINSISLNKNIVVAGIPQTYQYPISVGIGVGGMVSHHVGIGINTFFTPEFSNNEDLRLQDTYYKNNILLSNMIENEFKFQMKNDEVFKNKFTPFGSDYTIYLYVPKYSLENATFSSKVQIKMIIELKVIDKNNNIIYQDKKDNILFSDNYIYNESEIFYSKDALIKASNLAIRQIVARLILDMKKN